jgi:hypothetical protein
MSNRLDYAKVSAEGYRAFGAVTRGRSRSGYGQGLNMGWMPTP